MSDSSLQPGGTEPTSAIPATSTGAGPKAVKVTRMETTAAAKPLSYAPVAARASRRAYWASATRRWARDTFSREQIISSLKSLAWVAPLTVLIWIYAEREQLARL